MDVFDIYYKYAFVHKKFEEAHTSGFDLSELELEALNIICYGGGINQSNLGEQLGQNKTNISRLINRLEEKNLVERKQNKENKREKIITYGAKALEVLEGFNASLEAANQKIQSELTKEELESYQKVLNLMRREVEKLY